ncbi:fimbrial protein [Phytobacter diazotrophicus]|uniref:fimbrial protein n=1 Tax=Phytobacter diazotrophicus TaxID=395631 RepID=UPI0023308D9F|nr:fimbrial protein [Phytobacter diazotrophicus]MDC0726459.1 fimbrial protein [Phytobacter diazotrophicus]MDC0733694.1 fimbrial protein [Phytobacter diazotrophicus]
MKSLFLIPMVIAAISLVNTASAATNGTVNFSGKLTDQTCQVVLNNGSSASGTVELPTVSKELLTSGGGHTAGKTPFTLTLIGCKASTTTFGVTAYFPATAYTDGGGYLKNIETGTTAAERVTLEILQKNGTTEKPLKIGRPITDASYQFTTVAAGATSVTMHYAVRYKNSWVSGSQYNTTPGKVKGIAIYELAYQ